MAGAAGNQRCVQGVVNFVILCYLSVHPNQDQNSRRA